MTVQVSYKNKISSNNIVLFVDHIFNTKPIEKYLTKIELNYINGLIKKKDLKKNFHLFEINPKLGQAFHDAVRLRTLLLQSEDPHRGL